jgi:hypothetical protein
MDPEYRSPLVDMFRRGDVDRSVRLLAAQGALAPRAGEQVALLMLLVDDSDTEVAQTADRTLAALPSGPLHAFLAGADVLPSVRGFFAARGAVAASDPRADLAHAVLPPSPPTQTDAEPDVAPDMLASLSVIERVKLAMNGTREHRAQLIRDPNCLVASAVLSSPKVTESEVEAFAKMGNVSEEVLRIISTNRTWVKQYSVALGLARNPKTPPAISMHLLHRLTERDVKALAADRNVPERLRDAARRLTSST